MNQSQQIMEALGKDKVFVVTTSGGPTSRNQGQDVSDPAVIVRLMRGDSVKRDNLGSSAEVFKPTDWRGKTFRLENGKLPDHQPRVSAQEAADKVQAGEVRSATLVKGK